MAFNFLKKLFGKKENIKKQEVTHETKEKEIEKPKETEKTQETIEKKEEIPQQTFQEEEKPLAQKTDEELEKELIKISPELLTYAKTPEMRQKLINIFRRMLEDGVNPKDENQVKKWIKKHPELVYGGDFQKVETYRREKPKIGRNDPCPCGSGKKYKKCCGKDE